MLQFFDLSQITEKSNQPQVEAVLHIVLKFQFNRACFHGEEASANVDDSNSTCTMAKFFNTVWRFFCKEIGTAPLSVKVCLL